MAAASVERPAQGTTSAELAPANGGSTTLAAVGTCRAAAGKPPTPVRSQRCNIEATDGRRTGNDEGCRKSDADEEDDVHTNRNDKNSNNKNNNNNNNDNNSINHTSNNSKESEGDAGNDNDDVTDNNNGGNNENDNGDDQAGDGVDKEGRW